MGGDWTSFKDTPHLYLPNWGSTTGRLKANYGNPESFMATWSNHPELSYTRTQFIMDVQAACGAKVDGKAGTETISKTVTLSKKKNRNHAAVKAVQMRLSSMGYNCGEVDGWFGSKTEGAVKEFQRNNNCVRDGEITARKKTWKCLLGMI